MKNCKTRHLPKLLCTVLVLLLTVAVALAAAPAALAEGLPATTGAQGEPLPEGEGETQPAAPPENEADAPETEGQDETKEPGKTEGQDEGAATQKTSGETVPAADAVPTQDADAPFTVTTFTSSTFKNGHVVYGNPTLNQAAMDVKAYFDVPGAGGIPAGGTVTFVLQNGARNFFTAPDAARNIALPAGYVEGSLEITTSDDGKTVTVQFELTDLAQFNKFDTTVGFSFDHAHDGWIADDETMATVTVTAESGGKTSTASLDVVASVGHSKNLVLTKNPVGDTPTDAANLISLAFQDRSPTRWRFAPNTEVRVVLDYPADAVAENTSLPNATLLENTPGRLVYSLGTADENGHLFGSDSSYKDWISRQITLTFPSGAFEEGDELTVHAYLQAHLYGTPGYEDYTYTHPTASPNPNHFKIIEADIHLEPGVTFNSAYGGAYVDIDNWDQQSYMGPAINNVFNAGGSDIPDLAFTWQNDPGDNKANLSRLAFSISGESFKIRAVYTIKSATNPAAPPRTVAQFIKEGAPNSQIGFSTPTLAAGEYVDSVVMHPLNNPDDTVQELLAAYNAGADISVPAFTFGKKITSLRAYAKSWQGGYFPNGTTKIEHGATSQIAMQLTWRGESDPGSHTGPAFTTTGTGPDTLCTYTNDDPAAEGTKVHHCQNTPGPRVQIQLQSGEGGQLPPGSTINTNLSLANNYVVQGATSPWKDPEVLLFPPVSLVVDTTQPLAVYKYNTTTPVEGATATIAQVPADEVGGRLAYRITFAGIGEIPRSSGYQYTVPLTFTIKASAASGTYYFSRQYKNVYPQSAGMVFGVSSSPYNLMYPDGVASAGTWYDDSETDFDNNSATPYLYVGPGSAFTVTSSTNMQATARLYNADAEGDDKWQDVADPAARATVQVGGSGSFKLEIKNAGNTFLGAIKMLDILPHKANGANTDMTVLGGGTLRGSEWDATLQSLGVRLLDADGVDVTDETPDFTYDLRYSTAGDPSYSSGGLASSGNVSFTNRLTTDLALAKSFLFETTGSFRLPGGYTIVLTGTLDAPATAGEADIGKLAYNSFAMAATSYSAATGTAGTKVLDATEPDKQTFVLHDSLNSGITGLVFKDYNNNGTLDTTGAAAPADEVGFGEVVLRLYAAGSDGKATGEVLATTETLPDGSFSLGGTLAGGNYVVQAVLPQSPNANLPYQFSATANLGADGYTLPITVLAGQVKTLDFDIGIGAKTEVTVEYRLDDENNTLIHTDAPLRDYYAIGTPHTLPLSEMMLPAHYHAVGGTLPAETDAFTFAWSAAGVKRTVVVLIEPDDFAITYDLNDDDSGFKAAHSGAPASYNVYQLANGTVSLAAPTRTGYTFTGWTGSGITGDPVPSYSIPATSTGPLAFTANWEAISYTIRYELGDSSAYPATHSGAPASYTVAEVASSGVSLVEPTRLGYTFVGWTGGDIAGDAVTAHDIAATTSGDLTFTATWQAISYAISYGLNDDDSGFAASHTGTPAGYTADDLTNGTVSLTAPTRDGYTFAGWLGGSVTGGPALTHNIPTGTTGNLAFTATWQAIPYTISYELGGSGAYPATHGGTPASYTVAEVAASGVALTAPSRPGYTFTGWTGGDITGDAEVAHSIAATTLGNLSFTATWEAEPYTISYNLNDDDSAFKAAHAGTPDAYSADDFTAEGTVGLTAPTREGYTFTGWTGSGISGEPALTHSIPAGTTGNLTFTANWERILLTVTFDAAGGTPAPAAQTVPYGETATQPSTPQKLGYDASAWHTADGALYSFAAPVTGNLTLYAQFTPIPYTVTFNYNDGLESSESVNRFVGERVARPQNEARTGHTFLGWKYIEEGRLWNFDTDTMPAADVTLQAQWRVNRYTITYKLAAEEGAWNTQTAEYGRLVPNEYSGETAPTRAGYTFLRWEKAPGIAWNFAADTMPAEDITLVAQWSENSAPGPAQYTVHYSSLGKVFATETVPVGALVPNRTPPTRTGYAFAGYIRQDTGTSWNFTADTMPAGDLTLEARWRWNAGSGSGSAARSGTSGSISSRSAPTSAVSGSALNGAAAGSTASGSTLPPAAGGVSGSAAGAAIGEGSTPTSGFWGGEGSWSLLNLLLGIVCAVGSVWLLLTAFARRKRQNGREENEAYNASGKLVWRVLGIVMGLAAVSTFLLVDLPALLSAQPMAFMNFWSFFALLFTALMVVMALLARHTHTDSAEEMPGVETYPYGV